MLMTLAFRGQTALASSGLSNRNLALTIVDHRQFLPAYQPVTLVSVLDRSVMQCDAVRHYALVFSSRDKTPNTGPFQIVDIGPDRDLKKTQP
jgi:hypothetical protein